MEARRPLPSISALVTCALLVILGCSEAGESLSSSEPISADLGEQRVVSSRLYEIDQLYRSMEGPIGRVMTAVGDSRPDASPEILWITGIRSDVVDAEDGAPADDGLMCHTNVSFGKFVEHDRAFHPETEVRKSHPRIFTLSQGQLEVAFPPGFGIPILSTEPIAVDTQALNLNDPELDTKIRIRTTIDYVRDSALSRPMRPLMQRAAQGSVLVQGKDGYHGVSEGDPDQHGPGCEVGTPQTEANYQDPYGRVFAAHWQVPPGRQENHSLVTSFMAIPYDTTAHYFAVHLHPFATSLELRDLTTDITLFRSNARGPATGIGLEHVETFESEEGIPVYADHEYELVSVYENTSDEIQDSMALMFVYLLDQDFVKPTL